jgi:hypothetical protein
VETFGPMTMVKKGKKNRSITPGEGKTNKPRSMLLDTWNSMANLSSERSERESFQE